MLLTGQEYLESIRDGRRVHAGGELVNDVTAHPAFRNAARSFAMIYDRKREPENREVMTFEEGGDTFSTYFLLPRTREDLHRRYETHRRIASWTYGLMGRAPGQEKESITCVVPLNAPGVSIWPRKSYEHHALSEFDNPLSSRFDESDAAVLFENVHVPWERVFCVDDVE